MFLFNLNFGYLHDMLQPQYGQLQLQSPITGIIMQYWFWRVHHWTLKTSSHYTIKIKILIKILYSYNYTAVHSFHPLLRDLVSVFYPPIL